MLYDADQYVHVFQVGLRETPWQGFEDATALGAGGAQEVTLLANLPDHRHYPLVDAMRGTLYVPVAATAAGLAQVRGLVPRDPMTDSMVGDVAP